MISPSLKKEDESTSSLSISTDFPKPKKKILLSMEVITEEKPKDTSESYISDQKNRKIQMFQETEEGIKCPLQSEADLEIESMGRKKEKEGVLVSNKVKKACAKKNKKKENLISQKENKKKSEAQKKKCQMNKKNGKEKNSDHVLSFSSGTNLTQTTFDFGFSKLGSCECSLVDKNDPKKSEFLKSKLKKNKKTCSQKSEKILQTSTNKINKKKSSKSKLKIKKKKISNCQNDKKCCQCGKASTTSPRNSVLEVPNFIVQPFNKFDIELQPRNYDKDQRGTLGIILKFN
jgi:hypothetical protein